MESGAGMESDMSADFPARQDWLARRHTPANFHRTRGRLLYAGGTYVRPRGDPKLDARLVWYQRQCNANASKPLRRALRRRVV